MISSAPYQYFHQLVTGNRRVHKQLGEIIIQTIGAHTYRAIGVHIMTLVGWNFENVKVFVKLVVMVRDIETGAICVEVVFEMAVQVLGIGGGVENSHATCNQASRVMDFKNGLI